MPKQVSFQVRHASKGLARRGARHRWVGLTGLGRLGTKWVEGIAKASWQTTDCHSSATACLNPLAHAKNKLTILSYLKRGNHLHVRFSFAKSRSSLAGTYKGLPPTGPLLMTVRVEARLRFLRGTKELLDCVKHVCCSNMHYHARVPSAA